MYLDNDYEPSLPAAEEWLDRITTVHNHIHDILKHFNYKRSNLCVEKARHFNMDDRVLVDRRNIHAKAENNKYLTQKWLGPYKVIKAIGSHTYQFEVPESTRYYTPQDIWKARRASRHG